MSREDIIRFANEIKRNWHTSDPYVIANRCGILVSIRKSCIPSFTAQTIKLDGYPTIISINADYDETSRRLLCAHELGHALLHSNGVNHYSIASNYELERLERDANLFALSLLYDDINRQLNMPVEKMSNYILKSIIDCNLKKIQ